MFWWAVLPCPDELSPQTRFEVGGIFLCVGLIPPHRCSYEAAAFYIVALSSEDRRFYERSQEAGTYLETLAESERLPETKTVDDLLDSIENPKLFQALIAVDRLTLQIALWKMDGYSSLEISKKCGLSVNAVNFRMWHLRKKLKNIL